MGCIFWCRQLRFDIINERLAKDDEYPGGRFLMAETQAEWDIISKFHSNDPKTHTFYGKYFCCWIFLFVKLTKCVTLIAYFIPYGVYFTKNRTILRRSYSARPAAGGSVRFLSIFRHHTVPGEV